MCKSNTCLFTNIQWDMESWIVLHKDYMYFNSIWHDMYNHILIYSYLGEIQSIKSSEKLLWIHSSVEWNQNLAWSDGWVHFYNLILLPSIVFNFIHIGPLRKQGSSLSEVFMGPYSPRNTFYVPVALWISLSGKKSLWVRINPHTFWSAMQGRPEQQSVPSKSLPGPREGFKFRFSIWVSTRNKW